MKTITEITEWNLDYTIPGHTYFVSDSKDKAFAYIKAGSNTIEEFNKPYRFSTSGRKFTEVPNTWGFFPREELVLVGETFRVPGSKGAVYTVTNDRGSWSCTCPASKWQAGECKHIVQLKTVAAT
jgi:hypothetical protein